MDVSVNRQQAMQALAELIADQFTRDELLMFLRQKADLLALSRELPGPEAPSSSVGYAVVEALDRHGYLNGEFLARLSISRRHVRRQISDIVARLGLDPLRISPAAARISQIDPAAITQTLVVTVCAFVLVNAFADSSAVLTSAILAPLVLLRSEESTARGARMFITYQKWLRQHLGTPHTAIANPLADPPPMRILLEAGRALTMLPALIFGGLLIRLLATVRHPLSGTNSILSNWWHASFSQRLFAAPELVPNAGVPAIGSLDPQFVKYSLAWTMGGVVVISGFGKYFQILSDEASFALATWFWCVLLAAVILFIWNRLMVLAAVAYRVSLKATFALWFPVVLAIHVGTRPGLPADVYLEFARTSEIHRVQRTAAALTIGLFVMRRIGITWIVDVSGFTIFDGVSGILLCMAATLVLVVHYVVVEPAREHLRLGIRRWETIALVVESARMITVMALVTAIGWSIVIGI